MRGLYIGTCTNKWSSEYLYEVVEDAEQAVAHVSNEPRMNFIKKNFSYKQMTFKELVERSSGNGNDNCGDDHQKLVATAEHYYFRALGKNVRKDASDFREQFPSLQRDMQFPDVFPTGSLFSSVFRMSSASVQLWTHYDVMDNILIEVRGHKRVVLFPPDQALCMYLRNDKSLVVDIDHPDPGEYPLFLKAKRYECIMEPGDVLYIPALWFHNVTALNFCVAVNVFWRNLDAKMYDTRDVYGNKDLLLASRAQEGVNRACKLIHGLPNDYRDFYARKLIQSIKEKCLISD